MHKVVVKPAFGVKYENIWQDTHLFKLLCESCTKIKISITQLMFVQSVMSEMLQVWEKVEEIRIGFTSSTGTSQILVTAF